jgi:hypothetical protein
LVEADGRRAEGDQTKREDQGTTSEGKTEEADENGDDDDEEESRRREKEKERRRQMRQMRNTVIGAEEDDEAEGHGVGMDGGCSADGRAGKQGAVT